MSTDFPPSYSSSSGTLGSGKGRLFNILPEGMREGVALGGVGPWIWTAGGGMVFGITSILCASFTDMADGGGTGITASVASGSPFGPNMRSSDIDCLRALIHSFLRRTGCDMNDCHAMRKDHAPLTSACCQLLL